jgi:hypothetical protein
MLLVLQLERVALRLEKQRVQAWLEGNAQKRLLDRCGTKFQKMLLLMKRVKV